MLQRKRGYLSFPRSGIQDAVIQLFNRARGETYIRSCSCCDVPIVLFLHNVNRLCTNKAATVTAGQCPSGSDAIIEVTTTDAPYDDDQLKPSQRHCGAYCYHVQRRQDCFRTEDAWQRRCHAKRHGATSPSPVIKPEKSSTSYLGWPWFGPVRSSGLLRGPRTGPIVTAVDRTEP